MDASLKNALTEERLLLAAAVLAKLSDALEALPVQGNEDQKLAAKYHAIRASGRLAAAGSIAIALAFHLDEGMSLEEALAAAASGDMQIGLDWSRKIEELAERMKNKRGK